MTYLAPGIVAVLAFTSITSHAMAEAAFPGVRTDLEIGARADGVTAQGGVFLPVLSADGTIVYGSVRGGLIAPEIGYGAIGLGIRQAVTADLVLGAHAHYALNNSTSGHVYQKVVLGAEAFINGFELRGNAHLPVGTTQNQSDSHSILTTETGRLGIRQGYEQAMTVVDVEAGYAIPLSDAKDQMALKLFAGAYAQFADDVNPVYGFSGRAELHVASLTETIQGASLTLGAGVTHDSYNGTNASVYGRLAFNLDGSTPTLNPLYARTEFDPLVQTQSGAFGAVQNALLADGRIAGALANVTDETGDIAAINEALRLAGENAVLLASGALIVDDAIEMATGQIWLGGSGAITLTAEQTGTVMTLENGNARASVASTNASANVFEMADNSQIIATDITGGATGIYAQNVNSVVIADVSVSGVGAHGIHLEGVTGARIRDVAIADLVQCVGCGYTYSTPDIAEHAGLYLWGGSDISVERLSVDGSTFGVFAASKLGAGGATLETALSDITLSEIEIRNTREEAFMVALADAVTVSDLVIDNTGMEFTKDSVVFLNTTNATLTRADIAGGINGIMIANAPISAAPRTGNINISDVTIRDTTLGGLFINPADNVTFRNVHMTNLGDSTFSRGIFMLGGFFATPMSNIAFENVTVSGTPGTGVQAMGDIENVHGDIVVVDAGTECSYSVGPWSGSFAQDDGYTFSINGNPILPAASGALC